ncbi:hypothetical protein [Aquabacterium sp.]|uniref:hypothetical protein n=1 Tax=Aquabacterium sp. TaxID=1872578 RepID=UPI002CDFB52D|nr:hypothetical protein [Aquabacterium sp.]HSW08120.1 hypothetical protein [Aquabacterium sp.]
MNPVSLIHLSPDMMRNLQATHSGQGLPQTSGQRGERSWAMALMLITACAAIAFACLG